MIQYLTSKMVFFVLESMSLCFLYTLMILCLIFWSEVLFIDFWPDFFDFAALCPGALVTCTRTNQGLRQGLLLWELSGPPCSNGQGTPPPGSNPELPSLNSFFSLRLSNPHGRVDVPPRPKKRWLTFPWPRQGFESD